MQHLGDDETADPIIQGTAGEFSGHDLLDGLGIDERMPDTDASLLHLLLAGRTHIHEELVKLGDLFILGVTYMNGRVANDSWHRSLAAEDLHSLSPGGGPVGPDPG